MTTFDFDCEYLWKAASCQNWNSKWLSTAFPCSMKKLKKFCSLTKKSALHTISDNFRLWMPISLQWIEVSKIGIASNQLQPLPCWAKNYVNFGPQTKKFHCLILTYPKSALQVLCMLMHLSLGTCLRKERNSNPLNFPRNWTYSTGRTHIGLSPKFLLPYSVWKV